MNIIFRGLFVVLFISGCASGGGNSPPTVSVPGMMTPPTPMCTGGKTLVGGQCQCPAGSTEVGGQCSSGNPVPMTCSDGTYPVGNRCAELEDAIEHYFNSLNLSLPCGASRSSSSVIDKIECSRSSTPGLTQLAQANEEKMRNDLSEGREIPKLHSHDDDYVPNTDGTSTHGERSEAVVQQLGGGHLFERVSSTFSRIRTGQFNTRIVSSGFGGRLACSDGDTCPSDIVGLQSILVLPAGNRTIQDPVDVYEQGNEEDIRMHIEANTPFLLVVGYYENHVFPIVDLNGRHFEFIDLEIRFEDLTPNPDMANITRSITSSRCGEVAKSHCIAAPFGTGLQVPIKGRDFFVGTSNSHLYVATALAQALYLWPDLTNDELLQLVRDNAIDIGEPGVDIEFGLGLFSVQGLFSPSGDLVDPRTRTSLLSGTLALPFSVEVQGLDSYNRDFSIVLNEPGFDPFMILPKSHKGFLPFVTEDNFAEKGLMYQGEHFFSSVRVEGESFLGGYGTGSYQLGDTTWITAGLQSNLGPLYLKGSLTHGSMDSINGSLVKELDATYATIVLGGSFSSERTNLSFDVAYRSSMLINIDVQEHKRESVRDSLQGRVSLSFLF